VTFKTKPELGVEMIERAIADGLPAGLVLADSAYGDNSEFRRRVRCEGLGYASAYTVRPRCGAWICWDAESVTPWRSVIWPTPSGEWLSAGDLARRNEGKMSSRFATERVVLAQDDLVDPSQREAVWLLMEWPHGEKAATDFTATRCRRTCHGASSFGESSSGGAPNGCTRTPRESLGWITTRALLPRLEPPCVHGAGLLRVYRRRALQGFSPSAGKTATRKASHRHDGADGNRPERHFRDSFITVRLAVARVLATWLPDAPCVTDRDRWDRLVHMPVNTDGRLPF